MGLRILIADDNADAAVSLGMLLEDMQHQTRLVYDGGAAVGAVESFKPRVAILDIRMPALDGYEAARLIRKQRPPEELVLIALTGWAQEADREKAIQAGFDDYLVKPVEPEALHGVLTRAAALDPIRTNSLSGAV